MKTEFKSLFVVCMAGVLILGVSCGKKPAEQPIESAELKTFIDDEYDFKLELPNTWIITEGDTSNLAGKYGLTLLRYHKVKDPEKNFELRVYVLSNPDKKDINSFLTVKKESKKSVVEYVIPRALHENSPVPYVVAGYSYDPPVWGLIKAEIESMHALAPDQYVYMQLSATKAASSYVDTAKAVIESFAAADKQ